MNSVSSVAAATPQKMTVPMTMRDSAPGPKARIKGTAPAMVVTVVIRIGLSRVTEASTSASEKV